MRWSPFGRAVRLTHGFWILLIMGTPLQAAQGFGLSNTYSQASSSLMADLQSQDADTRFRAIRELQRSPTPPEQAIPLLAALLNDNSRLFDAGPTLGSEAVRVLVSRYGYLAIPAIVSALAEANSSARQNAISAFKSADFCISPFFHATPSLQVLDSLATALQDVSPEVRSSAACALGDFQAASAGAVPNLIIALSDHDSTVRAAAAHALGVIGPSARDAVPQLIAALKNPNEDVRAAAAQSLGLIDSPTLSGRYFGHLPDVFVEVEPLMKALNDTSGKVRGNAAEALGSFGPGAKAAVPALISLLNSTDTFCQEKAANALGGIGPDAKDAVPALVAALNSNDRSLLENATSSLGAIGPNAKDAVPALISILNGEDDYLKRYAAEALGDIGPAAKDAASALINTLKTGDSNLRAFAADALGDIGIVGKDQITALIAGLRDDDSKVRSACISGLVNISQELQNTTDVSMNTILDEVLTITTLNTPRDDGDLAKVKTSVMALNQIEKKLPTSDAAGNTAKEMGVGGDNTFEWDDSIPAFLRTATSFTLNGVDVSAKDLDQTSASFLGATPRQGLNVIGTAQTAVLLWREKRKLSLFTTPYKNSFAIIAAIDDYDRKRDPRKRGPTGFGQLGSMVASAEQLKAALVLLGFAPDHIISLYNEQADSTTVVGILKTFWKGGQRSSADRLFFYFGGHGSKVDDRGILVTYDYDPATPTLTSIPMHELTGQQSENIISKHVFIAIDACDSGLALPTLGGDFHDEEELKSFRRLSVIRNDTESKSRNILLAGTSDQSAVYDNGGIFTSALLRGLKGDADANHDGIIEAGELATFVRDDVAAEASRHGVIQQVGFYKLTSLGTGEVVFIKQQ